jgi:hypothetical protein
MECPLCHDRNADDSLFPGECSSSLIRLMSGERPQPYEQWTTAGERIARGMAR